MNHTMPNWRCIIHPATRGSALFLPTYKSKYVLSTNIFLEIAKESRGSLAILIFASFSKLRTKR